MNDPYFLHTARVGFRPWTAEDLPRAVAIWGSATGQIGDHSHPSARLPADRLAREMALWDTHRLGYFPAFLLDTGEHIGCCGVRPARPETGRSDVGIHLLSGHWKRSLAVEALRCVIGYAFGTGVRTLSAHHRPDDDNAEWVLATLGFSFYTIGFMPQTGLNHQCYVLRAGE